MTTPCPHCNRQRVCYCDRKPTRLVLIRMRKSRNYRQIAKDLKVPKGIVSLWVRQYKIPPTRRRQSISNGGRTSVIGKRIQAYIRQHSDEILTVAKIAKASNASPSFVCHHLRKMEGAGMAKRQRGERGYLWRVADEGGQVAQDGWPPEWPDLDKWKGALWVEWLEERHGQI